ncbi:undecaprenyl-diphosphatase [Actinacidiphila alni]|uniref:Undecaprenyl-diphosphatase n=1 Tax=Actinacidiphila alni TaxID=380248 RepID=A0A1I2C290_9ACTN|nr:phosphatase PAP2 family protein [Actinacidiphila alni]SFE62556.1 undecaprenyl-diphosphatase [Actinacidiphila alni]
MPVDESDATGPAGPSRGPAPSPARWLALPAGCAVAFALLAWLVLARHGTPYGPDTGPHRWSVAHRPHTMATAARTVTALGTGPFPYLAAVLGGWLAGGGSTARGALRTGRGLPTALLALVVLLAGQAVRTGLMAAFRRARPPAADWATHVSGHSFPSGHTASSAMAAGLLAWGLLRWRPGRTGRLLAAGCALVALAVGCTRVYLGVHWPTDVLGGWLLAACWLGAALPPLTAFAAGRGPAASGPPDDSAG